MSAYFTPLKINIKRLSEYESMQEKIELFEEIQKAEVQLSAGLGVSNSDARAQILKRIKEIK